MKINSPFNVFSNIKKTVLPLLAAMTLMLSSCFSTGLGTSSSTSSTGGVLTSVLGTILNNVLLGGMSFDESSMLGSWNYSAPTTAFTTEKTLTKAGGASAISNINSSLVSNYNSIGINRNNTSFSFLSGNKFSAKVNGIPFSGTYTYNSQNGEIALTTPTETIKGTAIKTQKGMGLMFDSTQMVNLLQKEGKVSNTAAVEAVSKLAKSSNGARVGLSLPNKRSTLESSHLSLTKSSYTSRRSGLMPAT